jgi:hypothetical protein
VSRCSQFPEHLFGVDKTATLNVFLRGQEGTVEGGTVIRVEPVTRIKGQELNLRSLRQLRGVFHYEATVVNSGLDRHVKRVPRVCLARQCAPWDPDGVTGGSVQPLEVQLSEVPEN